MADKKEDNNNTNQSETLAGQYSKMESERDPYLAKARQCAKLTIPTLFPEHQTSGHQKFVTPYQGVGARGINNISSKLLLALFPPNQPFFRLSVDSQVLDEMGSSKGEAEEALSIIEQRVIKEFNSSPSIRIQALEAIKQLIVAGNVLVYLPPKTNTLRVFRLDRYVVNRDAMGNLLCAIVKEELAPEAMPKEIKEELDVPSNLEYKDTALYTKIKRDDNQWVVTQECMGKTLESTRTTYPMDKCPWLALRLIALDNEDYGRSYVEEYLGDLISLEGLTKAIVEGSIASAKTLFMVSPNGTTRKKTLAEARNLDIVEGNAQDVSVLRVEKGSDFRVALETANGITERLSFAFMLNSAVQRQGERVTAEEIRYVASELEDSLGGIYSNMAQDLQLPLVTIMMSKLQREKKIPSLPKDMVTPTIVTGMEALGRTADLQRLDMFVQSLTVLGQQAVEQYLNIDEYIKRRASALQIETKGLVRSRDEVMQEQQQMMQQQQMAQMAQSAIPNAVKGMMDGANQPPPQQ
jgi:hypothetical protein